VIFGSLVALWSAAYAAAAAIARVRVIAAGAPSPTARPSELGAEADDAVLVRPLAGVERGLADRLSRAGGARVVRFALGTADDGAAPLARDAAKALRERGLDAAVIVTRARGPNHKSDQLARALATDAGRAARIVVVADSDVDLGDDAVTRLLDAMNGADAAWAPPVERGPTTTWGDRASQAVLGASLHSFPLLAGIHPSGLVGKLFAVRREALDAVGGFAALTTFLGEDMELARRLREAGSRVIVAPLVAHAMGSGRELRDVLARYVRWLLVVRAQRAYLLPSYPFLLAATPLLLGLLIASLARHDTVLLVATCAGLLVRLGIACMARSVGGQRFAPVTAIGQSLLADATLMIAFGLALSTRTITWRGRCLAITSGGELRDVGVPSGGQDANEQALGEQAEEARLTGDDTLEALGNVGRAHGDPLVDALELALDALALDEHPLAHVTLGDERTAERDPHVGLLGCAEDVPETDRKHDGALGDASDLRGAGAEIELGERRSLAALGKDPERAALRAEQPGGVTDGARAVGRILEVDPERPDAPEKRDAAQIGGVHHRVAVGREQELGDVEGHERVPPARVVGDQQDGRVGEERDCVVTTSHQHTTEGLANARARVTREPRVEPGALRGLDHEGVSR